MIFAAIAIASFGLVLLAWLAWEYRRAPLVDDRDDSEFHRDWREDE